MLRPFTVAALAAIAVLMMAPGVGAGVLIGDVVATTSGGDVTATAAHGFILGNDVQSGGNPLLGFLNSGSGDTILTLHPDGNRFKISGEGMFGSTDRTGLSVPEGFIDVVDYKNGFLGYNSSKPWAFASKRNYNDDGSLGAAEGPEDLFGARTGSTLALNSSLAVGSYVLSLKGGGGGGGKNDRYAVFLFQNVEDKITSFTYDFDKFGLSHASLFWVSSDTVVGPDGVLPEPASLAVFGFGALLGVGGMVRRRFPNRKGFALSGLAA